MHVIQIWETTGNAWRSSNALAVRRQSTAMEMLWYASKRHLVGCTAQEIRCIGMGDNLVVFGACAHGNRMFMIVTRMFWIEKHTSYNLCRKFQWSPCILPKHAQQAPLAGALPRISLEMWAYVRGLLVGEAKFPTSTNVKLDEQQNDKFAPRRRIWQKLR